MPTTSVITVQELLVKNRKTGTYSIARMLLNEDGDVDRKYIVDCYDRKFSRSDLENEFRTICSNLGQIG